MDVWEGVVGQRIGYTALDQIGRTRLSVGRVPALLGMDGLEHMAHLADLGRRHVAEDVTVKTLDRLLSQNEAKSSRERLTLIRLFEELRERGYDGGYDAVRRYARRSQSHVGRLLRSSNMATTVLDRLTGCHLPQGTSLSN